MKSTVSNAETPAITACHHLAICVHDIEAARHFYGSLLGLEELERPQEIAANFRSAWYLVGLSELHVVENGDFQPLNSPLGPHFAVAVNNFTGFTEQIRLGGGRFAFGPARGPDGIERAVIKDPTGNVVEITAAPSR